MMEENKNNQINKELKNLFVLFGAILVGEIEVIREMIEKGININSRTQDFSFNGFEKELSKTATISRLDTALLIALKHNSNFDTIKFLLENGADTSLKDQDGKNALDIASERNLADILKLFNSEKILK